MSTRPLSRPVSFYSIQELAELINRWCEEHAVNPVNGQASDRLTERNIRYYRQRGLLDAPGDGLQGISRRGFTVKHAAQLKVIRLLQARGMPLDHIQQHLAGRGLPELEALERQELHLPEPPPPPTPSSPAVASHHGNGTFPAAGAGAALLGAGAALAQENWLVSTLNNDFLLVSRRGQQLSDEKRRLLVALLGA